jgi:hypothetical protein
MKSNDIIDSKGRLDVGFWSGHYDVPLFGFTVWGLGFLYFALLPGDDSVRSIHRLVPTCLIAAGIALFFLQRRKLKFRTLGEVADVESFKAGVRKIMKADAWKAEHRGKMVEVGRWRVEHDIKKFMQASWVVGGLLVSALSPSNDMITFRFDGHTASYNLINDPEAFRSGLACLFSRYKRGKRLIKKIKEQTKIETR